MVICPGCGEENPPKFRLCGYCGTPLASAAPPALPPHEVRKTVTLIFCDLKDSTSLGEKLDSEALHEVKERYFAAMAAEITKHGGKIEKYIGDAIMAVFGLPRAHEDDALRAVRAAAGMHAALDAVNAELGPRYGVHLANRTGVNTGEVVAQEDGRSDQKLATGDAVNLAARLEQAAPVDQILLGEATYALVRDAVEVAPVEPLTVKGKAQTVRAFRLLAVRGHDGVARRHDRPLVGREAELAQLSAAYAEALSSRTARMVTVIGDAGAGKSRLVREVLQRVAEGARTLTGRCLPYGDGITFWPLLMMLREAAGITDTDSPAEARAKLLAEAGDAEVVERLASAAGLSEASFPLHEINWAARAFLERLARRAPLVALVDDIHWAEPAFLDLLQHVLATSSDAPILLLATARHELLENRPDWSTEDRARRLVLEPLSDEDSARVVANLLEAAALPPEVMARIVKAAGGNPLYAEQLLSMLIDQGVIRQEQGQWVRTDAQAEITIPPTIHALLGERLDRLHRAERATVEPASVIGLDFERAAVASLAPESLRPALSDHLGALERKQFIHLSAHADMTYRFHHHLVRETVYNGLLKRTRAQLHLQFVRWASRVNAERDRELEFEEILGYHLEQAHRYLRELGPLDAEGLAIGAEASQRLSSAARRVFARGDMHAAANLYQRAVALLPEDDPRRLPLLPELADALIERGEFAHARAIADQADAAAVRAGNARIQASAQLMRLRVQIYTAEADNWSGEVLRLADTTIPQLEAEEAHVELARAWRLVGFVHGMAARYGQSSDAVIRSMTHARAAGDERLIARNAMGLSISSLLGPMPVPEAIALCEAMLAEHMGDRLARSKILCTLGQLQAMTGEFDAARTLCRQGRGLLAELGQGVNAASTGIDLLAVELLAGDLAGAERAVMADLEFLRRARETYFLSTIAAMLSKAVRDQGRDDDAMVLSQEAEVNAAADDVESQALWRSIRAPILARAGRVAEAEALVRSAVELAQRTDSPPLQGDTWSELASVLAIAGRVDEARAAIGRAHGLYAAKGDPVSTRRAQVWAARLA